MRFTNSKVLFDEEMFETVVWSKNSNLNLLYVYAYEVYLKVKVQNELINTAVLFNGIQETMNANKAYTLKTSAYGRYKTELEERVAKFKHDLENGRYLVRTLSA